MVSVMLADVNKNINRDKIVNTYEACLTDPAYFRVLV